MTIPLQHVHEVNSPLHVFLKPPLKLRLSGAPVVFFADDIILFSKFPDEQITSDMASRGKLAASAYQGHFDLNELGLDRAAVAVDNVEARAMMILSGHYLGFLPPHYARSWIEKGSLHPIGQVTHFAQLDFYLLKRNGPNLPRTVRASHVQILEARGRNKKPLWTCFLEHRT